MLQSASNRSSGQQLTTYLPDNMLSIHECYVNANHTLAETRSMAVAYNASCLTSTLGKVPVISEVA